MRRRAILRKIIRILFIAALVLGILEFFSIGFNGCGFFTSLYLTLPKLWPLISRNISQNPEYWRSLLYYVISVWALLLFLFVILPFLALVIGKVKCYITLWYTCVRQRYRFKICRFPFRSLSYASETPDIKIEMAEKTLCIHFIDVLYASRRLVTFMDATKYCIQQIFPKRLVLRSGLVVSRGEEKSFRRKRDRPRWEIIKQIPQFTPSPGEYHILVLMPGSVTAQVTEGFELIDVSGEVWYKGYMICRAKILKRRLRGELRTPFHRP